MTLQDLISRLAAADQALVLPHGFGSPHSYRGDYAQLAFPPTPNVAVADMLEHARQAMGKTFTGYKGGEYTAHEYTEVYLANWGECGEEIGPTLLDFMLASAKANDLVPGRPALAGYSIQHVDGRWRTLDSSGMPDWTDKQADALCFSLRSHADLYAQDDPEDVRIVPVGVYDAQPAQAVEKQPVAYLVTDPADDQISHIVRTQEFANKLKADGYTIEALVIGHVPDEGATFQQRVQPWLMECFGPVIAGDREERNHRFLEEALELVQACGCSANEAHQLVNYVFGRPVGERHQEVGGAMVTLAALCLANDLDMHADGEAELARISVPETVAKIRAKQAAKPKHSPLPAAREPIHASDAEPNYCARKVLVPLTEPVSVRKAMLGGKLARVVLSGGTGPVAAVHLLNIGVSGWIYTKETAEAFARGFNMAASWMQDAMEARPAPAVDAGHATHATKKFLSNDDFADLLSFSQQVEDGDADGYTASKKAMRRLTELGIVQSHGFGRYSVTAFGHWVIETEFSQNPLLPLRTIDEHNARELAGHNLYNKGMQPTAWVELRPAEREKWRVTAERELPTSAKGEA